MAPKEALRGRTLAALWLAAVAILGTLTWQVVDAAGRSALLGAREPTQFSETNPASRTSSPSPRASVGAPRASGVPRPSAVETATPRATTPGGSGVSGATSSPTRAPSAPSAPRSVEEPATNPPSQPPAPTTRTATRTVSAGSVTVSCNGAQIRLQSAVPRNGYAAETEVRADRVEVEFEPVSDAEDAEDVKVRATCVGGTPSFRVD